MNNQPITIITYLLALYLVIAILIQPVIGIAVIGASLSIVDLFPNIPMLSSSIILVGLVTFIGYLMIKKKGTGSVKFTLNRIQTTGLLFVIWIFVSNPGAALLGASRNWILTYLQLWLLLYMAGDILDTPQKHHIFMGIFATFSIISAFYAIETGVIRESFQTSTRAEGFSDNPNAAARYFVIAMVFFTYLRTTFKSQWLKVFSLVGIFITYLGVFYTLSRTGIVLLFAAQGLIILFQTGTKQRIGLVILFLMALIGLWFLTESIFDIVGTFLPIITRGEDTMGLRYNLWKSGWLMWRDHPIFGVGIGRFPIELRHYIWRLPGIRVWNAVAHNSYIQVLAETGIVGFGLFISMIVQALNNFININIERDSELFSLRNAWLIVFLVILIGSITKSDHADKFFWIVMSVSAYFASAKFSPEKALTREHPDSFSVNNYYRQA